MFIETFKIKSIMAVIGKINNVENIFSHESLKIVFDYLKASLDSSSLIYKKLKSLEEGSFVREEITNDIFAYLQVDKTKNRDECFIESHIKYVDFQMIVTGLEQMEFVDVNNLDTISKYDEIKDLTIYKMVDDTSRILMQNGVLAVFLPDDGHIGLSKYKECSLIHKIIIKVPSFYFDNIKD